MRGQAGFFDVEERLKELSAKGDALERLTAVVDFELFRGDLERAVPRSDGSKGGRSAGRLRGRERLPAGVPRSGDALVGGGPPRGRAGSAGLMGRFETEWLPRPANLAALADLPGQWI